jgi:hypothetical protein
MGFTWPVRILVLAVMLFGVVALDRPALAPRQSAAAQGPVVTSPAAGANPDQYFVQGLRAALKNDQLSASDRQVLQQKLAYNERLAAQRAPASSERGPKGTESLLAPVPMPQVLDPAPAQPVERILDGSEGAVHSWEASVTNMWEGLHQDVPTQVFAGAVPDNAAQGLVMVLTYPLNGSQPTRQIYLAPSPAGALRILERQADRLLCSAADGSSLLFNLETRSFEP